MARRGQHYPKEWRWGCAYEGTWDEIATHAPEFRGRRLRLLVLSDEPSPSLEERRAFIRLPLEGRRRILAEQAERLAEHYESDTEWRDFLSGDIVGRGGGYA